MAVEAFSTSTLLSVEDFASLRLSDTQDYELVEGELIPLSSGNLVHAKIRQRLERLLAEYFEANPLGNVAAEVDCLVGPATVRRPDVAVYVEERWRKLNRKRIPLHLAPDIAIEVLSPSESAVELHRKTLEYLAAGAQEVWLVDHENGEVFIHRANGVLLCRAPQALASSILPGFSADLSSLFAEV